MGINAQRNGRSVLSEINVTPFVDVMLVLLVIFMVTAPILYHGVDIRLPAVESKPIPAAESERKIVITLDERGEVLLEKEVVPLADLRVRIRQEIKERGKDPREEHVFLRADSRVPYGRVVEVMAEVKKAGIDKLGLITDPFVLKDQGSRE